MNRTKIFTAVIAASLTSAALYAAPGAMRDADGNGAVTKVEAMAAADARFAKMDANADGVLNEADKAAMVTKRFVSMDVDKNGSLSQAEFVAAHEARAEKRENRRDERQALAHHDEGAVATPDTRAGETRGPASDLGVEFGEREREVVDVAPVGAAARDFQRRGVRLRRGHEREMPRDVGVVHRLGANGFGHGDEMRHGAAG